MNIPALFAAATSWLPGWAAALLVLVLIVAAGLLIQAVAAKLLTRAAIAWTPLARIALARTRGVARFALAIFAVGVALPLMRLDHATQDAAQRVLAAAIIVLLGWMVVVATDVAIERYIARFRLDVEDNLLARKAVTQVRVLHRCINILIVLLTAGFALMTFESVRQYGISLFASAGVAGIVAGLAARPMLSNVFAGMQLALTQPIRLDDAVLVNGEFGKVEEFTSTYVVIKLWDWRRMIVPLSYFFENPFQNWTRSSAALIGSVYLFVDYTLPVERVRAELSNIVKSSKLWDGKVVNLQVSDAMESVMQLRALVSARNSGDAWDLRCEVREKLIAYIQREFPGALPRRRNETVTAGAVMQDGRDLAPAPEIGKRN